MRFFLWTFLLILSISCAKKATMTNPDMNKKHMIFGNGGGFTGGVNAIVLFENGEIYRQESFDSIYTYLGKIEESKAKQQFANYNTLGISKMELNDPGNRYYFITFEEKGITHKIQWGRNELKQKGPAVLHKITMDLVAKLESSIQKEKNVDLKK